jgi:hypothetical protein
VLELLHDDDDTDSAYGYDEVDLRGSGSGSGRDWDWDWDLRAFWRRLVRWAGRSGSTWDWDWDWLSATLSGSSGVVSVDSLIGLFRTREAGTEREVF